MSSFSKGKIGDMLTLQRGFDITKTTQTDGNYPVVSSSGVTSYHNKFMAKGPGVVIGRKGTLGSAFYLENDYWPHDTTLWVKDFKGNDPKFIYYFLKALPLERLDSGSANPTLNRNVVHQLDALKPEPKLQGKIAAVLSALDAKINCNNRINGELESMAKTLYDYWFVQFDFPDAYGKPYKSSGGKMVYNAILKREIPAGWKAGMASDLFDFNPTLSLPMKTVARYIDMNSLPVTGFMTSPPVRKAFGGGMKFQNGDVVIARITPCLENGKTAVISLLDDGEIGFGSTEFIILRGKNLSLTAFGAQLSRSTSFRSFAIANMTGTSGRKRIDASTLETFSLPLPHKDLLKMYEATASSIFERMTNNAKENQHLTELRNWLLPMLMNGQVSVI